MGVVSFGSGEKDRKQNYKANTVKHVRNWPYEREKLKFEHVRDDNEEIYSLSKAKGCSEDEIYRLQLKDYYLMISVLEKNLKRREDNKGGAEPL